MRPFAIRGLGELWLRGDAAVAVRGAVSPPGLGDRPAMSTAEIYAYRELLLRVDRGRAFLRIMRGFELTEEKQRLLCGRPRRAAVPGADHLGRARPGARPRPACAGVQRVLGVDDAVLLPAKHFLQEDQATAVAYAIADQVAPLG